jgi:chloramphenicol 3-O phosphotransferase
MATGAVIILNGPSSSGKTTLAQAIQARSAEPWLHLGLDAFVDGLDRRFLDLDGQRPIELVEGRIELGPVAGRLVSAMQSAVVAVARTGMNVIADHILLDPRWFEHYQAQAEGIPTLLIAVTAPAVVIEAREQARGDRVLGMASAQALVVHQHVRHALTVDTHTMSAEACAATILSALPGDASTTASPERSKP